MYYIRGLETDIATMIKLDKLLFAVDDGKLELQRRSYNCSVENLCHLEYINMSRIS